MQARYLSVTEAPHIIESLRLSGGETFNFFEKYAAYVSKTVEYAGILWHM